MLRQVNPATFGPDGDTIDAVRAAIEMVRKSAHEAIERMNMRQAHALLHCLNALTRTADALHTC